MSRSQWNIEQFSEINLPEKIGSVNDKESFSNQDTPIRVLDLPVHMKTQGTRIPAFIPNVYQDIIHTVIAHEQALYGDIKDMYVYITIDQKLVKAGKTGRRAGAHSDAYIERDNKQIDITHEAHDVVTKEEGQISHTYVVSDCLPTEFFKSGFPLVDTTCEGSLKTFDEIANQSEVVTYDNYDILKLTPYVVHRSAVSNTDTTRTFMKVSVSNKRYAREGNSKNELFDYDWSMKPRNNVRNHPW